MSQRNEAQIVSKIQVQNVFVKVAKFTPLKMYSSLLVFISPLIAKYYPQCIVFSNGEKAYLQNMLQIYKICYNVMKTTFSLLGVHVVLFQI